MHTRRQELHFLECVSDFVKLFQLKKEVMIIATRASMMEKWYMPSLISREMAMQAKCLLWRYKDLAHSTIQKSRRGGMSLPS